MCPVFNRYAWPQLLDWMVQMKNTSAAAECSIDSAALDGWPSLQHDFFSPLSETSVCLLFPFPQRKGFSR